MRIVNPHWGTAAATAALALFALTGCQSTPTPVPIPTATADAPVFASDEEALAAATEAYAAYLKVVDNVLAEGGTDITPMSKVASGDALVAEIDTAANYKGQGYRSTGVSNFDSISIQSVEHVDGRAIIRTYLCADVTGVDVVNANGASIVPADRVSRYPLEVVFKSAEPRSPHLLITSSETWTGRNFC